MYRNLLFGLIALFITACASKSVVVYEEVEIKRNDMNLRVLEAFNYERFDDKTAARDAFLGLFKDYNQSRFLENAFLLTLANNLDKAQELNDLAKPYLNESENLKRLSTIYALQNYDINTAYKLSLELVKSPDHRNYELHGDVLIKLNKIKEALKFFNKAYELNQNEELLLKIVGTYGVLNDSKSAKIALEKHSEMNGCSLKTCLILAKIYADEKNANGLEKVSLSLYELTQNKEILLNLVQFLDTQNQRQKALDIALKYDLSPDIQIYLYQALKKYKEAASLSLEIYKQSGDKNYLLRAAILEFEEATQNKRQNKSVAYQVSLKFEEGISDESEALYLNYYGYLLIDYEIDVQKGISLVQKALQKEPANAYYIDSLAWGYYKLGDCARANETLKQILNDKEYTSSADGKAHIKAIRACK